MGCSFHKLMFTVILWQVQEIKATSSKAKTQDMVAIRHSVSTSDQQRTTVILLCEDGSLRIYMASAEHTGYWMAPEFQPTRLVWCILTLTLRVSEKKTQFRLITWRCGKISVPSSGASRFSFQASNFFKTSLAQWARVQASHSVTKSFSTTRMQWPRSRKTCELPVLKTTWNTTLFRRDKFY